MISQHGSGATRARPGKRIQAGTGASHNRPTRPPITLPPPHVPYARAAGEMAKVPRAGTPSPPQITRPFPSARDSRLNLKPGACHPSTGPDPSEPPAAPRRTGASEALCKFLKSGGRRHRRAKSDSFQRPPLPPSATHPPAQIFPSINTAARIPSSESDTRTTLRRSCVYLPRGQPSDSDRR